MLHYSILAAILSWILAARSDAQFVTPPSNLITRKGYANVTVRYTEVPAGICEIDPNVKSFSGYADIAPNQHIFWWFFEARHEDPTKAPLTVWINGGPGSSSMIGLFQENGPCSINSDLKPHYNPYSWTNVTNMLYIDQPTQTGFSYDIPVPAYKDPTTGLFVVLGDNHCPDYAADFSCGTYSYPNESLTASSTTQAAPSFWLTLQGFMGAFPQYSQEEFFFTTESYGGHYGPIFNDYIENQNAKNIPGTKKISLAGIMIGSGWYDPLIQYQAYYNFTVNPGTTYDFQFFNKSIQNLMYDNLYAPGNCVDKIKDCYSRGLNEVCSEADNFCANEVENIYDIYTGRDEYDIRQLMPDPFPPEFYTQYLNQEYVLKAIGAFVNYTESSNTVSNAFTTTGDDGRILTTVSDMKRLLDQNVSVTMYTGDADYNCNWYGGQVVSQEVGARNFKKAGYVNVTTSDCIVHGQVKQAGKFSFLRIYESGHEVPFYQPVIALEMLERVLAGLDIATGTVEVTPGYITSGTVESTYREGNSTIHLAAVSTDGEHSSTAGTSSTRALGNGAMKKRHNVARAHEKAR